MNEQICQVSEILIHHNCYKLQTRSKIQLIRPSVELLCHVMYALSDVTQLHTHVYGL